jgi:hypothetical protein
MASMEKFITLCGSVVGGDSQPFEMVYGWNGNQYDTREEAIATGFLERNSDDFNVGVVLEGKLVSLDWMSKPVDTDPALLAKIATQIGLYAAQ